MIASSRGRTLENYCHASEGGCKLFHTKADAIPVELLAAVTCASSLRERSKLSGGKWLPLLDQLPFWQFEAYRLHERVRLIVEHERIDDPEGRHQDEVPKEHRDGVNKLRESMGMKPFGAGA